MKSAFSCGGYTRGGVDLDREMTRKWGGIISACGTAADVTTGQRAPSNAYRTAADMPIDSGTNVADQGVTVAKVDAESQELQTSRELEEMMSVLEDLEARLAEERKVGAIAKSGLVDLNTRMREERQRACSERAELERRLEDADAQVKLHTSSTGAALRVQEQDIIAQCAADLEERLRTKEVEFVHAMQSEKELAVKQKQALDARLAEAVKQKQQLGARLAVTAKEKQQLKARLVEENAAVERATTSCEESTNEMSKLRSLLASASTKEPCNECLQLPEMEVQLVELRATVLKLQQQLQQQLQHTAEGEKVDHEKLEKERERHIELSARFETAERLRAKSDKAAKEASAAIAVLELEKTEAVKAHTQIVKDKNDLEAELLKLQDLLAVNARLNAQDKDSETSLAQQREDVASAEVQLSELGASIDSIQAAHAEKMKLIEPSDEAKRKEEQRINQEKQALLVCEAEVQKMRTSLAANEQKSRNFACGDVSVEVGRLQAIIGAMDKQAKHESDKAARKNGRLEVALAQEQAKSASLEVESVKKLKVERTRAAKQKEELEERLAYEREAVTKARAQLKELATALADETTSQRKLECTQALELADKEKEELTTVAGREKEELNELLALQREAIAKEVDATSTARAELFEFRAVNKSLENKLTAALKERQQAMQEKEQLQTSLEECKGAVEQTSELQNELRQQQELACSRGVELQQLQQMIHANELAHSEQMQGTIDSMSAASVQKAEELEACLEVLAELQLELSKEQASSLRSRDQPTKLQAAMEVMEATTAAVLSLDQHNGARISKEKSQEEQKEAEHVSSLRQAAQQLGQAQDDSKQAKQEVAELVAALESLEVKHCQRLEAQHEALRAMGSVLKEQGSQVQTLSAQHQELCHQKLQLEQKISSQNDAAAKLQASHAALRQEVDRAKEQQQETDNRMKVQQEEADRAKQQGDATKEMRQHAEEAISNEADLTARLDLAESASTRNANIAKGVRAAMHMMEQKHSEMMDGRTVQAGKDKAQLESKLLRAQATTIQNDVALRESQAELRVLQVDYNRVQAQNVQLERLVMVPKEAALESKEVANPNTKGWHEQLVPSGPSRAFVAMVEQIELLKSGHPKPNRIYQQEPHATLPSMQQEPHATLPSMHLLKKAKEPPAKKEPVLPRKVRAGFQPGFKWQLLQNSMTCLMK